MKKIKKFRYAKSILSQFKNVWGVSKFFYLKSIKKKKRKNSFFCELLNSKKVLRIFYMNLKRTSLKDTFLRSKLSPYYGIDRFISFLESRLDMVLYRCCFSSSPKHSKFYISRKFVLVNGKPAKKCNLILYKYDIIQFSMKFFLNNHCGYELKSFFMKDFFLRPVSSHLEIDYNSLQIIFLWEPRVLHCYFPVSTSTNFISRFYF